MSLSSFQKYKKNFDHVFRILLTSSFMTSRVKNLGIFQNFDISISKNATKVIDPSLDSLYNVDNDKISFVRY